MRLTTVRQLVRLLSDPVCFKAGEAPSLQIEHSRGRNLRNSQGDGELGSRCFSRLAPGDQVEYLASALDRRHERIEDLQSLTSPILVRVGVAHDRIQSPGFVPHDQVRPDALGRDSVHEIHSAERLRGRPQPNSRSRTAQKQGGTR